MKNKNTKIISFHNRKYRLFSFFLSDSIRRLNMYIPANFVEKLTSLMLFSSTLSFNKHKDKYTYEYIWLDTKIVFEKSEARRWSRTGRHPSIQPHFHKHL